MGLAPDVLRLLVRLHGEYHFEGPVITLGVQDVWATLEEARTIFAAEGMQPCEPAQLLPATSTVMPKELGHIHAQTLFQMMGLEGYDALDMLTDERPSLIHDLNEPIPEGWRDRYRFLLDGGTLEHIFDQRTALNNVASLLQEGGLVLHVSPLYGWVNHGFYQMSPCLFFDYYQANGFDPLAAQVVGLCAKDIRQPASIRAYQHSVDRLEIEEAGRLGLFVFLARKVQSAFPCQTPTQGYYKCKQVEGSAGSSVIRPHNLIPSNTDPGSPSSSGRRPGGS